MPGFNASQAQFTPSTTVDNWTLSGLTGGDNCKITQFHWGGGQVATIKYITRWVRPTTAGVGSGTAITHGSDDPGFNTPLFQANSVYATTPPVIPAAGVGDLYRTDWNAHGGLGYIVLPLNKEWKVINGLLTGEFSCRNEAGVDANGSSYGLGWFE